MDLLPRELLIHLFSLIPLKDKVSMTRVSRSWRCLTMRELADVVVIQSESSGCRFSPCCWDRRRVEKYDATDLSAWSLVLTLCPSVRSLCLGSGMLHWSDQMVDLISDKVGLVECLCWRDVVLHRPLRLPHIRHLTCKVVSQESLSSVLSTLTSLSCRGTTFTEWERLPHGFRELDASSYTHVDLHRLLRAPALHTLTTLCLFCNQIPDVLPEQQMGGKRAVNLMQLRIHSRYPSRVSQRQLRLIQEMVSHCDLRHLSLCVTRPEFLSLPDMDSFFQSFPGLRSISLWSGWRIHHVDEIAILVRNCPLLQKADIYFASLTDQGLDAVTGLSELQELSMRRSLTAVTTPAFLRFVDRMFARSLRSLWFGGPVTFTQDQQQDLLSLRNGHNLTIDFRKSFEVPAEQDFFLTPTPADLRVEHVRIRKLR